MRIWLKHQELLATIFIFEATINPGDHIVLMTICHQLKKKNDTLIKTSYQVS